MTALWETAGLRAATGGVLAADVAVHGVSIDSRTVAPGNLFVALRDARDGHEFVGDALSRGAACAMVDHDPPGVAADAPLLRVADTLVGLRALGAAGRARSEARVVAVTGSVGKTGTKDMLRLLLGAFGPTHAAAASYNNHWGVPLTLARLPPAAGFAVVEIGMNNPGEIAPLSRLARPHVAAITAIGPAHVGHLGSVEAIAREKASIVEGLEPGGTAVLPADQPLLREAAERAGARVLLFGEGGDVRLLHAEADAHGTRATIAVGGPAIAVSMPASGVHHAGNAACALAVIAALGLDATAAAPALRDYAPAAGRGAARRIAVAGGHATLIDESYNAAPPAMQAALDALLLHPGRRVAVLGAMRELGDHSAALHAALAPAAARADIVFACGDDMRPLWNALPADRRGAFAPTSDALAPIVRDALRPGDVVLVKGALGIRMATIVAALSA